MVPTSVLSLTASLARIIGEKIIYPVLILPRRHVNACKVSVWRACRRKWPISCTFGKIKKTVWDPNHIFRNLWLTENPCCTSTVHEKMSTVYRYRASVGTATTYTRTYFKSATGYKTTLFYIILKNWQPNNFVS
jgi:hypothetical protein